ncbi:MAG: hypothetical protein JWM94_1628 [Sphingomonas bacterium]|nr:hypothetical protein [Sphingomonas bacterium]
MTDEEALEAGYTPDEVRWGEHQSTPIPLWGCLLALAVVGAIIYAICQIV